MATYIKYGEGEDDAVVQGAEWLRVVIRTQKGEKDEEKFQEQFKALYAEVDSPKFDIGPVFDLFADHSEEVFAAIPEVRFEEKAKEVESFFALVLSILPELEETAKLDHSTSRLCELFANSSTQHPELRLRLLMMLYNTFNNPTFEFRYRVFKHILDYSSKAGLFDLVVPYLEYLDDWMVDWAAYMSDEDRQTLFLDISSYMRELGKRIEAFVYLRKYGKLFQGASEEELTSKRAQAGAILLIKDAVQLPTVMQFDDIVSLDLVKALGKSKQDGDLVKLCHVFLSGGVDELKDFQKKSQKVFDDHDLIFEDAMSKIRLLAIATLALGKSEIPLAEVAKVIQESQDKVEPWVVRALSDGVIDGRIDQLNQTVLVKSAFQRTFGQDEWAFLDEKLTGWSENLESLIKFIGEQKKSGTFASA